jgi:exodeoxyribonuclease-3
VRIVTWNCCRRNYVNAIAALAPLKADVVFLQEVGKPASPQTSVAWVGTNTVQGMLVGALHGRFIVTGAKPFGNVAKPVTVDGPVPFVALNVWSQPDPTFVKYVHATLDHFRKALTAGPCVIAGDFNSEGPQNGDDKPHHTKLVKRLRDEFGLVSAYHTRHGVDHGAEAHATYYHQRHLDDPWHIDFCFVPHCWTEKLSAAEVLDGDPWRRLSDHRPVVVDIDV